MSLSRFEFPNLAGTQGIYLSQLGGITVHATGVFSRYSTISARGTNTYFTSFYRAIYFTVFHPSAFQYISLYSEPIFLSIFHYISLYFDPIFFSIFHYISLYSEPILFSIFHYISLYYEPIFFSIFHSTPCSHQPCSLPATSLRQFDHWKGFPTFIVIILRYYWSFLIRLNQS